PRDAPLSREHPVGRRSRRHLCLSSIDPEASGCEEYSVTQSMGRQAEIAAADGWENKKNPLRRTRCEIDGASKLLRLPSIRCLRIAIPRRAVIFEPRCRYSPLIDHPPPSAYSRPAPTAEPVRVFVITTP